MPTKLNELIPIEDKIIGFLNENRELAYSSKEIAEGLDIAHSTARKHLNNLFKKGKLKRGKQRNYNKTFFYYVG